MTVTGSRSGSFEGEPEDRIGSYVQDLEKNPFVLPSDEEVRNRPGDEETFMSQSRSYCFLRHAGIIR